MFLRDHQGIQHACVGELGLQKVSLLLGGAGGKVHQLVEGGTGDISQHQLEAGGLGRVPAGRDRLGLGPEPGKFPLLLPLFLQQDLQRIFSSISRSRRADSQMRVHSSI